MTVVVPLPVAAALELAWVADVAAIEVATADAVVDAAAEVAWEAAPDEDTEAKFPGLTLWVPEEAAVTVALETGETVFATPEDEAATDEAAMDEPALLEPDAALAATPPQLPVGGWKL